MRVITTFLPAFFSFLLCVCISPPYNSYSFIYFILSILANILHSYCCICSVFLLPLIYFSACTLPFGRYCGFLLFLFPFSLILRKSKNVFFFFFFTPACNASIMNDEVISDTIRCAYSSQDVLTNVPFTLFFR